MRYQVTSVMLQMAYTSGKGSCCGNRDFEQYLDDIMPRNSLQKPADSKKALEVYFRLTMLAET